MNRLLNRNLLIAMLSVFMFLGIENKATGQESLHDSLRKMLVYIGNNTTDEKLKQAIKDIQAIYVGDTITDAVEKKLIGLEIKILQLRELQKKCLHFFELVTNLLKQVRPQSESPAYTVSLKFLKDLYLRLGLYEKAEPLHQANLALQREVSGTEQPGYVVALEHLASLYDNMNQYEKALPLYQEVVAVHKKFLGKEHPGYVRVLGKLGSFYLRNRLDEKAVPVYEELWAIEEKKGDERAWNYAHNLFDLTGLYQRLGQYEKALSAHQTLLSIRKRNDGNKNPKYASALEGLANFYSVTRQYEKALPLQREAVAILKKTPGTEYHKFYARSLTTLAYCLRSLHQYEQALPLLREALEIYRKTIGEENYAFAGTLHSLGLLYIDLGDKAGAVPLLIQACEQQIKWHKSIYSTPFNKQTEEDRINHIGNAVQYFGLLPSLLAAENAHQIPLLQQIYLNELSLKGMLLENQKHLLNVIRSYRDSASLRLYEQWRTNRASLGRLLLALKKEGTTNFDSLQKVNNRLEQQLFRNSVSINKYLQGLQLSTKGISDRLSAGEAVVEFIRFPFYNNRWTDSLMYAALVLLPNDSVPRFVSLFEEKQLQRLLTTYTVQQLYGNKRPGRLVKNIFSPVNDTLYRLIWKPLEQHLSGSHTVYYAPAGLLHRVAFQALQTDSTHLLMDKFRLNQLLSSRSVASSADTVNKSITASVWGDIDYNSTTEKMESGNTAPIPGSTDTSLPVIVLFTPDDSAARDKELNPLPWTKQELDSLEKVFTKAGLPFTAQSRMSATEEAFKALDGNSPQVLHLATHGFFLPVKELKPNDNELNGDNTFTVQLNPMFRSGLILAGGNHAWTGKPVPADSEDGILTAYELAQMDLSTTDLVVLSACETALGDLRGNEGVIGLQRAFKMAGVKQLIVSLWQVSDKATMELMTLFYQNWLGGQSIREALRNAQLRLKEKYPPFYWAAFVLIE